MKRPVSFFALLLAGLALAAPILLVQPPADAQEGYRVNRQGLRPLPRPTATPAAGSRQPSVGVTPQRGQYDPEAASAIRTAIDALRDYRGLLWDFDRAKTEQERAAILRSEEQLTAGALQAAFNAVAETRRNDPPTRVLIYQVAKDALGSGNRSGNISDRIAYNVDALRKIAGQQPY